MEHFYLCMVQHGSASLHGPARLCLSACMPARFAGWLQVAHKHVAACIRLPLHTSHHHVPAHSLTSAWHASVPHRRRPAVTAIQPGAHQANVRGRRSLFYRFSPTPGDPGHHGAAAAAASKLTNAVVMMEAGTRNCPLNAHMLHACPLSTNKGLACCRLALAYLGTTRG